MCSCADPARDVDCDQVIAETSTPSTPTPARTTPLATPTATPEPSTTTPSGSGGGVGGDRVAWVPKVGDTWQYNLNTPVNTDVNADVFFIDMGESRMPPRNNRALVRFGLECSIYIIQFFGEFGFTSHRIKEKKTRSGGRHLKKHLHVIIMRPYAACPGERIVDGD